jgi:hypothetical protein
MQEPERPRPSLFDLATAGSAGLVILAVAPITTIRKLAALAFATIILVIVVATHWHEFVSAFHERKANWRLFAVLAVVLLLVVVLSSTVPDLLARSEPTASSASPPSDPPPAKEHADRHPTSNDFGLAATSPTTMAPGGTFSFVLRNISSPRRPIECQVFVPDNINGYFESSAGSCDNIVLRTRGGLIPRSADGRARVTDPTVFSPRVEVRFEDRRINLVVAGLENGQVLSVDNAVAIVTTPEHLVLSPSAPLVVHARLQSGPMPLGFECEWSDPLDSLWNLSRRRLSANGCDYQIAIVDGTRTRDRIKSYEQLGQIAQAGANLTGFPLGLLVRSNGEPYLGIQLRGRVQVLE